MTVALLFGVCLVSLSRPSLAGQITCTAEVNRTTVPQGENISLTVTAEGDVNWSAKFEIPEIPGVQIFGGGTNQSVAYVNGQTMTTVAKSYFLKVDTDQDFTIGSFQITSDDKSCSTDPIAIEVTAPAPNGGSNNTQIPPNDSGNRTERPQDYGTSSVLGQSDDDIFITLEAVDDEAWIGEQVILSFKYYRRIQPWNNPQFTAPRTEGFWREDLGQERRFRAVVKGRSYNVTEIRYALFPTRTGTLTIEPAELSFPDQGLERFFSSRRRRGPRTLRTDPVTIEVKPLPAGAPENFSGLVANQVNLDGAVDRQTVPRGEPVSWKLQLVSDGFLKGFGGLDIPEPATSRTHDAGESFATEVANNRLLSAITVEKVIVPAEEGVLDVPAVELSWFDADSGRYRVAKAAPRRIMVNPSNLPYQPEEDSGFLRNEVARLAQDLAFIHTPPGKLSMGRFSPFTSGIWWFALWLPVALLAAWKVFLMRVAAQRRDPAARRRRLALINAQALLKNVDDQVADHGEQSEGLTLISRAIAGFVSDWSNVPAASVGPREVQDFAQAVGAAETGQALREIMDQSETTRFGGGASSAEKSTAELSQLAGQLLTRLEKACHHSRKKSPDKGSAGLALGLLAMVTFFVFQAPLAQAETDPHRLMAEAAQAYTQGELDQTLDLYLEAEELGVEDAVLFFNLGNTYARRGELGRAVAYYLKAQRLNPRDGDVAQNLAWVRSHISDLELSSAPLPLFIAQFVWVAKFLTVGEWSVVFLVLVWVFAGILAVAWYRENFTDALRRSALIAGALLFLVGAVFFWRWHGEEVRSQAVVIVSEVSVHSGPADSFPVLFKVHDGLTVFLEGRQQGWVRISLGGESLGWLPEGGVLTVNPDHQGR